MKWFIGSSHESYGTNLRLLNILPIPMFKQETDWLASWDIVLQMVYMFVFIFEVDFQLNYCKKDELNVLAVNWTQLEIQVDLRALNRGAT